MLRCCRGSRLAGDHLAARRRTSLLALFCLNPPYFLLADGLARPARGREQAHGDGRQREGDQRADDRHGIVPQRLSKYQGAADDPEEVGHARSRGDRTHAIAVLEAAGISPMRTRACIGMDLS